MLEERREPQIILFTKWRKMKVYESVVSDTLLSHFHRQEGHTLMNHAANVCGIEETLAVASLLWPTIIEDGGYIFIAEFYTQDLEQLKKQFKNIKSKIERWVNAWSLADFFLLADSPSVHDDVLITAFGETLRFFWSLRLQTLFPDRKFVVEVDEGIEGERGLAITFYQVDV
jgi:hypothetical protein